MKVHRLPHLAFIYRNQRIFITVIKIRKGHNQVQFPWARGTATSNPFVVHGSKGGFAQVFIIRLVLSKHHFPPREGLVQLFDVLPLAVTKR